MLYPDIFRSLEAVRWNMQEDIPWGNFEANQLTEVGGTRLGTDP